MKLSINMESVDVLNEFADIMPKVLNNICHDTQTLFDQYNSLQDEVGPCSEKIAQMLILVKNSEETYSEAILELSKRLKQTADKMESYLQQVTSNTNAGKINSTVIKTGNKMYSSAIYKRLSANSIKVVKDLFDKYSTQIRIDDHDYFGVPHYDQNTKGISINAHADMNNPTGSCSSYFHEVGHMIDHLGAKNQVWLSSDIEFKKCLENDANAYIQQIMESNNCSRMDAYDTISDELSGNVNASVSDIFGGLSDGRCQGDWGHHYAYWHSGEDRIVKEAFAHMFESSIGNEDKRKAMEKYFPSAYLKFQEIIRRANK